MATRRPIILNADLYEEMSPGDVVPPDVVVLANPGECQLRLSLNSELAVHVSGDIIFTTTTSGRTTSGTTNIFVGSGVISGLCPGMVVVGSGIPTGTFVTQISGFTSVNISKAATHSTSGGNTLQFWPSAIYAMPMDGRRISLSDGTNWSGYVWISGAGSRLLIYDNTQTALFKSGSAFNSKISGLVDTYQLQKGMLVIASGYVPSGTVIQSIESATSLTMTQNSVSGSPSGVAVLFMIPPKSGGDSSGGIWDIFATARSGVPWLQLGNQWQTTTARLDPLLREASGGVMVNSGVIN